MLMFARRLFGRTTYTTDGCGMLHMWLRVSDTSTARQLGAVANLVRRVRRFHR